VVLVVYEYNKLVRDKIVERIQGKGFEAKYEILDDSSYEKELNKKLLEEVNEYLEDQNLEELADIMEVINAILEVKKITFDNLEEAIIEKRNEKGSFKNKLFLKEVIE